MTIYIAGNTGTMRREKALVDLGIARLLSFFYIISKDFGADKAYRYALHQKGHPNALLPGDMGYPVPIGADTEEFGT